MLSNSLTMLRIIAWLIISTGLLAVTPAQAWATLYSSSKAYLHLLDNTVLTIPMDSNISAETASSVLEQLTSPPANSSLALVNNSTLLAFHGTSTCSNLQVSLYNYQHSTWDIVKTSSTPKYLKESVYFSDSSQSLVYFYGGVGDSSCRTAGGSTDQFISEDLMVFNSSSNSFSQVPSPNFPTELYGAGAAQVGPDAFLLVGGKASQGWIGTNQLALWEYESWTFRSVKNYTQIDSRTGPLVLPLVGSGSDQPITTDLNTVGVLVLGGEVDNRDAEPFVSVLNFDKSQGWTWGAPTPAQQISRAGTLGAVSLYNTLITITASSSTSQIKRDVSGFNLNMFDTTSWEQVKEYTPPPSPSSAAVSSTTSASSSETQSASATASTPSSKPTPLSSGGIAAVSTAVPVAITAAVGCVLFMLYRRRSKRNQQRAPLSPSSNEISDFFLGRTYSSFSTRQIPSLPEDSASIKSWNEKRVWYERNSGIDSDVTLPRNSQVDPFRDPTEASLEKPSDDIFADPSDDNLFEGRDVQILVSSLRRSRLRVTNPDLDLNRSDSRATQNDLVRRTPSGGSEPDSHHSVQS